MGLIGLLLVLATFADGAFDARYWAPIGIFSLALTAALLIGGAVGLPSRGPVAIGLIALWGFVGWDLISITWAESPGGAWEGAGRTITYASLATIALLAAGGIRERRLLSGALLGAVAGIGVLTLIRLYVDGEDTFLAGRLDDPIGYRNGTAALFAFSAWPLIGLAAERGRHPLQRTAAFAGLVLGLDLAFLTQSRGVVAGLLAGAVVSIAIGPDRLRRCWLALGGVAIVAIVSGSLLTPYDAFDGGEGVASEQDIRTAANAVLASITLGGIAAFLFASFDNGLRSNPDLDAKAGRVGAAGLAVILVAGTVGALAMIGNPASFADEKLDEFTNLEEAEPSGSTRLGSVGGQRYDLWRIGWDQFSEQPVAGVGESSYVIGYYQERRTDRNLSDPHSLPLRLLAETGLIGFGLFIAFLIAVGIAIGRAARLLEPGDRVWVAGLAAAGTTIVAQSLVDWIWLLPGLMGLGLLALALAAGVQPHTNGAAAARVLPRGPALASGIAAAVLALGVALFYLSDLYVREARATGDSPQERLDAAEAAERFNPLSVTPLYLQASAHESLGDREAARDALEQAAEREPGNFVAVGLLGDLEFRAGNRDEARELYARALELNPRDIGLQELAGVAPPEE